MAIIDNGGQYVHRIWRSFRELGIEAKIVREEKELKETKLDGIVLSGGPSIEKASLSFKVLEMEPEVPVLGICLGHQIMAKYFGGEIGPGKRREYGRVEIEIVSPSPLFKGLPQKFVAWASHMDEVKRAPPGFKITARSEFCEIEAMELEDKMFGVQFHPEVTHTQHGKEILRNFYRVCLLYSHRAFLRGSLRAFLR